MLTQSLLSDEELIDEEVADGEEIDYEDEESLESEEDLSDIDDDDLMKRLEAKYGKISGESSEDDEDPAASWTSNYEMTITNNKNLLLFFSLIPFSFIAFLFH